MGSDTKLVARSHHQSQESLASYHIEAALSSVQVHDPNDPLNWSFWYKFWISTQLTILTMIASIGSSVLSPVLDAMAKELEMSQKAAVMAISLYFLGFAIGPLIQAPVGEIWGRKMALLPSMSCFAVFSIVAANAKNKETLLAMRFLMGFSGAAPLSLVSAALGDIWDRRTRGAANAIHALAGTCGPTIAPLIGAAVSSDPYMGWRWTHYLMAALAIFFTLMGTIFLPETYGPVLAKERARKLGTKYGLSDSTRFDQHEQKEPTAYQLVTKHLLLPTKMLCTELLVISLSIYAAFTYALVYATLVIFQHVYSELRQWPLIPSTLPFLSIHVGLALGTAINLFVEHRLFHNPTSTRTLLLPESRCPYLVLGGLLFAAGVFWFGFTAPPERYAHWAPGTCGSAAMAAGFAVVFQQCVCFLVDAYSGDGDGGDNGNGSGSGSGSGNDSFAASAVGASSFLRCLAGAGLPLVAGPAVRRWGVERCTAVLGAAALALVPVPWLFVRFGERLRARSPYARRCGVEKRGEEILMGVV